MEQPTSIRLGELRRRLDLLDEEVASFPDPGDEEAYLAFRATFLEWFTEMNATLGPYPERREEMTATVRIPRRLRRTRLLGLRAALAIYKRRLAALMHGWSD